MKNPIIENLRVAVVPSETGNDIDQRSSVEDILACEETKLYPVTDYFQAQNNEELPMHWSFLIDITNNIEWTGANLNSIHMNRKTIEKNQAIITKDYMSEGEYKGEYDNKVITLQKAGTVRKRFKLYDDDDILYYEGYFYDDDESENQMYLMDWGMYDSGCTKILVAEENGEFVLEID